MYMYMNQFFNISLLNECSVYTTFLILLCFTGGLHGFSLMKRLLLMAVCGLSDGNISVSQYIASIGRMIRE